VAIEDFGRYVLANTLVAAVEAAGLDIRGFRQVAAKYLSRHKNTILCHQPERVAHSRRPSARRVPVDAQASGGVGIRRALRPDRDPLDLLSCQIPQQIRQFSLIFACILLHTAPPSSTPHHHAWLA